MGEAIGRSTTDRRGAFGSDRPAHPDWLADLAADLDLATRVATRLRPDGLIEVTVAGVTLGFVEHVAPVFVALAGDRPSTAVEVAQRYSLAGAVDELRAGRDR